MHNIALKFVLHYFAFYKIGSQKKETKSKILFCAAFFIFCPLVYNFFFKINKT